MSAEGPVRQLSAAAAECVTRTRAECNYSLRNKRDRHRYWNFHANVSTFYTLRGEQSQTGDRQLLWRDINVDVERQWNRKLKTSLLFSCQEWNPDHGFSSRTYASNIFVGDVTYKFDRKKSLRAEVQYLFSQDYEGNWVAGRLEFGLAPKWSFFVSDMYNQGGTKGETNKNYYNGGFSYTHNRTRVQISYGRNLLGLGAVSCLPTMRIILPQKSASPHIARVKFYIVHGRLRDNLVASPTGAFKTRVRQLVWCV